jgi:hypothetical protein
MRQPARSRFVISLSLIAAASVLIGASQSLLGNCGPFTDVAADSFCSFVLEIFSLGITTGTTATTYDPASNVTRLQMAAFLSRTVDGTLKRAGRRAALGQFWTPQNELAMALTTLGASPRQVRSDGTDLWVSDIGGTVTRVRGADGASAGTWSGAVNASAVLVAMGKIFVSGLDTTGKLYRIDPGLPPGAVTTLATNLGLGPLGLAFDGTKVWSANGGGASVSIITPAASPPWPVTTVSSGFSYPVAALFDGNNVWVADQVAGTLLKLNGSGGVLLTVTVGLGLTTPVFDGTNLWAPNVFSNTVSVVRASNGSVLATLSGNGLAGPMEAAFDGQRILVTDNGGDRVSLWKAADLTPLGFSPTGASTFPTSACSDGLDFWIVLNSGRLARF